jgi:hypothetical protein
MLLSTEGQTGEAWEASKAVLLPKSGIVGY